MSDPNPPRPFDTHHGHGDGTACAFCGMPKTPLDLAGRILAGIIFGSVVLVFGQAVYVGARFMGWL